MKDKSSRHYLGGINRYLDSINLGKTALGPHSANTGAAFEAMPVAGAALAATEASAVPHPPAAALPAGYAHHGGLVWMPVTFIDTWANANAYCAAFNGLGQTGWRMPTLVELSALSRSGKVFGQGWALGRTWSSTAFDTDHHYHVSLINGIAHWNDDALHYWVSCVRAGNAS